jgi:hypothetical protein
MIGSDNRTIIFHKATARIVCTLSEDALAPNRGTIANHTNTNDSDTNNIPNTVPKTNWAPTWRVRPFQSMCTTSFSFAQGLDGMGGWSVRKSG